jgi:hypothetical protein
MMKFKEIFMTNHLPTPSGERPQPNPHHTEASLPHPEAEQAQAQAERRQALAPRAELAQSALEKAAFQLDRQDDTFGAEQFRNTAEGVAEIAERAARSGEAAKVYSFLDLELKSELGAGGQRNLWEAVHGELGTNFDNPHNFPGNNPNNLPNMIKLKDIPRLP